MPSYVLTGIIIGAALGTTLAVIFYDSVPIGTVIGGIFGGIIVWIYEKYFEPKQELTK